MSTTVPVPAPLASRPVPTPLFPISPVPWGPADGEPVQTPEDVAPMLRLHALGWGAKRIAAKMGCARNTVTRYLAAGQWAPKAPQPGPKPLDALWPWIEDRFYRDRGNADVVRQHLRRELGLTVSLRTVERAVAPLRQALRAAARATTRFETAPDEQLWIDFGKRSVMIAYFGPSRSPVSDQADPSIRSMAITRFSAPDQVFPLMSIAR